MVPRVFGLAQKVVKYWLGNSKFLLHLHSLIGYAEGGPKPSFGFSVRKMGLSLNASLNCGVLIARSGINTWSLQLLSMMCCAGQESV